jgi:hypothetical protein
MNGIADDGTIPFNPPYAVFVDGSRMDNPPPGIQIAPDAPLSAGAAQRGMFAGSGLFINTDRIKVGIYAGYGLFAHGMSGNTFGIDTATDEIYSLIDEQYSVVKTGFKMAILPLANTADWRYVGKVLNNLLGYIGMGDDVVYVPEEEKPGAKAEAVMKALNYALDFTFNSFDLGSA